MCSTCLLMDAPWCGGGHVESVDVPELLDQAVSLASRINRFFVGREESILDKLIDIGDLEQEETFEVQAKGIVQDKAMFEAGLVHHDVHVTGHTSRDQYDTYFFFSASPGERLRYREDNVIRADGTVDPIYFLALTGPAKEAEFADSVVLTRSRYTAPSSRSLRFYREYFQPQGEREIVKHRERYHIRYKGLDFAVNLDRIESPPQDQLFVEIKSRTWSQRDAVRKAHLISELLGIFGAQPEDLLQHEYVDLFANEEPD